MRYGNQDFGFSKVTFPLGACRHQNLQDGRAALVSESPLLLYMYNTHTKQGRLSSLCCTSHLAVFMLNIFLDNMHLFNPQHRTTLSRGKSHPYRRTDSKKTLISGVIRCQTKGRHTFLFVLISIWQA